MELLIIFYIVVFFRKIISFVFIIISFPLIPYIMAYRYWNEKRTTSILLVVSYSFLYLFTILISLIKK